MTTVSSTDTWVPPFSFEKLRLIPTLMCLGFYPSSYSCIKGSSLSSCDILAALSAMKEDFVKSPLALKCC